MPTDNEFANTSSNDPKTSPCKKPKTLSSKLETSSTLKGQKTTTTDDSQSKPSSSNTSRTVDSHYIAKEPIMADQFIPRFLRQEESFDKVKGRGSVGVKGFLCSDYNRFNPYLMMSDITVGPPLMFPDHPHCGHEMMLYVIDGEFTHEDFMGWKETFKTGDVHWMTTGKGIIHAQAPGKTPNNRHVQFWINLPKDKKLIEPANQVLRSNKVPIISMDELKIKLLVGKYKGEQSSITTHTPLLMMDVCLGAGKKTASLKVPGDFFIGTFILKGDGSIGGQLIKENSITLSKAGASGETVLEIKNNSEKEELRFLLYAGSPINEPMDFDGFFVCCNKEETKKAITDFDQKANSFNKGKSWCSQLGK